MSEFCDFHISEGAHIHNLEKQTQQKQEQLRELFALLLGAGSRCTQMSFSKSFLQVKWKNFTDWTSWKL